MHTSADEILTVLHFTIKCSSLVTVLSIETMAMHGAVLFSYAFFILILLLSLPCTAIDQEYRKTYIVYLGSLPNDDEFSPLSHHIGILERVVEGTSASNFFIRSYKRSLNGFAAKLSDQEREKLGSMKEVTSVFPSTPYHAPLRRIMPTFC